MRQPSALALPHVHGLPPAPPAPHRHPPPQRCRRGRAGCCCRSTTSCSSRWRKACWRRCACVRARAHSPPHKVRRLPPIPTHPTALTPAAPGGGAGASVHGGRGRGAGCPRTRGGALPRAPERGAQLGGADGAGRWRWVVLDSRVCACLCVVHRCASEWARSLPCKRVDDFVGGGGVTRAARRRSLPLSAAGWVGG